MSDNKLKVTIREEINLNGDSYDSLNINTLENINEISKRILTIPTGSEQELVRFDSNVGSGTFINTDVKYMRFTNLGTVSSSFNPNDRLAVINITFKSFSEEEFAVKIPQGQTFLYNGVHPNGVSGSSMAASGSALSSSLEEVYTSLSNITVQTSGSGDCDLEYLIASATQL